MPCAPVPSPRRPQKPPRWLPHRFAHHGAEGAGTVAQFGGNLPHGHAARSQRHGLGQYHLLAPLRESARELGAKQACHRARAGACVLCPGAQGFVACGVGQHRLAQVAQALVVRQVYAQLYGGGAAQLAQYQGVEVALAEQYYPELDSGLVAKYALVHDLVEAYVGDTPTYDIDEAGLKTKVDMEQAGRQQLKKEYLHLAPSLVALVEDYEEQASPEARFVRIVDKLMPTVIQFADDYAMTRKSFTRETHQAMTQAHIGRFLEEYADQRPVLDLYQELAAFMRDRAWPD